MIDPVTVQKIKDTADIVEVVSDYVHLIRRGGNFVGLCPFHNERTPSFSVNKGKNFCYCFSCKKGGSPINFVMEKEGLSYHEALLHLAKKYGIEVHERELTDEERKSQSEREAMLIANEWAMQQMHENLLNTEEGRSIGLSYLYQRGVTEEAIRKFKLGYAIDKGDALVKSAKRAGYDLEVLKKLGLIGTSKEGREYDRFRGRVIFPVFNSSGKVFAFGGRDLKGGLAKYINSPESQIYKKSNELYGIFQARSEMVKQDKCFLVEGYLDVIGMWQSGIQNVVASSGTALTDGQIALIHRFTNNITLIYDGDEAGIKASLRGIDMLLSHNMNVKVMLLPDGDDPDSFAKKHTPEEFRNYIAEHETDIIQFKARVMLNDIKDPVRRINAVNSVVQSIAHISDSVSRDVYIQECSTIMGISENTIAKAVAEARFLLVEKLKKEKSLSNFQSTQQPNQNTEKSQNSPTNPALDSNQLDSSSQSQQGIDPQANSGNGYQQQSNFKLHTATSNLPSPLEDKIIEYCLKYGFLDMCMLIDEDGTNIPLSVINYVREELEADGLSFSSDVYTKVLNHIIELIPLFYQDLANFKLNLENQIKSKMEAGYEEIRMGDYSVAEIKKAEKKLNDSIEEFRNNQIKEFTKEYISRKLASDENDEVRITCIRMLQERHHLSQIYQKGDMPIERDEDRLQYLVPRAMTEWRSEILTNRLKNILAEFHNIAGKGNTEREEELMMEITNINKLRSRVAKEIGDRILSPR